MREIDAGALAAWLASPSPPPLLDVREPHETAGGVLPGAVACPRGALAARLPELGLDPEAPVVVYCARGGRAREGARTLEARGHRDVRVLVPGFDAWQVEGRPVAAASGAPEPVEGPRLSPAARARYARHLGLAEVGEAGQAKLLASRVLVVGAGGLGSPALLYLAAAGVGTLGLVDDDVVDASNLQRQIVHATSRVGQAKVDSARTALADLAPDVRVVGLRERLDAQRARELVRGWDVVVDGSDNAPTRYALNDAAVTEGVPLVHGSAARFDGQVTTFVSPRAAARLGCAAGPCYRCLFPVPAGDDLAPSCETAGVLGVVPGVVGTLQATEVLKLLLGRGRTLVGRLLVYDALEMTFRGIALARDPACPVCGET